MIREILEAGDATALQEVARELREIKTREAAVAGCSIEAIAKWPAEQLMAVACYTLRALCRLISPGQSCATRNAAHRTGMIETWRGEGGRPAEEDRPGLD